MLFGRCVGERLTKAIVLQAKPGLAVFISLGNFFLSQHKGCTKVGHTKLRVFLTAENSLMYAAVWLRYNLQRGFIYITPERAVQTSQVNVTE